MIRQGRLLPFQRDIGCVGSSQFDSSGAGISAKRRRSSGRPTWMVEQLSAAADQEVSQDCLLQDEIQRPRTFHQVPAA